MYYLFFRLNLYDKWETVQTRYLIYPKHWDIFTLLTLQTSAETFEDSADPDETARNKPSHQDLHSVLFWFWF